MRHRVAKRHFNRDTKHRQAMIVNLVRSLIEQGEIKTTTEKAKEVRRWADKVVTKAKIGDLTSRRVLHRFFGKRDVVNTLVDRIAPLFADRKSGFTTKESLGKRRGDNASMTKLSLIVKPETVATLKNTSSDLSTAKNVITKSDSKKTAIKVDSKKSLVKSNANSSKKQLTPVTDKSRKNLNTKAATHKTVKK
jgi:large subunit ribosomal protein L17